MAWVSTALGCMSMDDTAFQTGVADAEADLAGGRSRYFAGTRGSWGEFFSQIMRERFGVAVVHIDCFTWEEKRSYEAGYNQTILSHLAARFGSEAFDRTWQEVQEYRQEQYRSSPVSHGERPDSS